MTDVDNTGTASAFMLGTPIRFFDGGLLSSGVSNFDFARLVVFQRQDGTEKFYFVGQYVTDTVYANWTTGDTAVTVLQFPLDWPSSNWGQLITNPAVTAAVDAAVEFFFSGCMGKRSKFGIGGPGEFLFGRCRLFGRNEHARAAGRRTRMEFRYVRPVHDFECGYCIGKRGHMELGE